MTYVNDKAKEKSASAKCYETKIKTNAGFYTKEEKRVAMKERYKTDEEYKARIKEQRKGSYYRRKEAKMISSIAVI